VVTGLNARLVQSWCHGRGVTFHRAENLPVADYNHRVREDEGAIEPSVERVDGSGPHHSPPAQQVPRAEEEVIQRQKIGEAVDDQRYDPGGGYEDQSVLLREDLSVEIPVLDTKVPIESRQSHEVDRHLGQNGHRESVGFADGVAEPPLTVDSGVYSQRHDGTSG